MPSPTDRTWRLSEPRLLAEILDLGLEDGRNFGGRGCPLAGPFMAIRRFWSLVLSELSTIREPTLTMSPPRMAGSTLSERSTSRPILPLMASLSAAMCGSTSASAEVTSAGDLAAGGGHQLPIRLEHVHDQKQPAVLVRSRMKLCASPRSPPWRRWHRARRSGRRRKTPDSSPADA